MQSDAQRYVASRLAAEARGLSVAGARDKAIEILGDCDSVFGDRAQALSAQLFDEACEAEGIGATAQMFDDVIDRSVLESKVRYYAGALDAAEPDVVSFERMVSQLGGYHARRAAHANTLRNCELSHVRYARVPGGGETCRFCMMLAGRGFVYHSEGSAVGHQYHPHCDCVAVPGRKGRTAIEGYDPGACARLAQKFEEIDGLEGLTGSQREALRAAWSSALIGEDPAGLKCNPEDVAALYGDGLKDAKNRFVRQGKTRQAYERNVDRYLSSIGEPFKVSLSGQALPAKNGRVCGAIPNGDEIWAALRGSRGGDSVVFLASPSGTGRHPDLLLNGNPVEIKTPESLGKVGDRLRSASGQFGEYPDSDRTVFISELRVGEGSTGDIEEIANTMVNRGLVDRVRVVSI